MADDFDFAKQYYSDGNLDMDSFIPRLSAKFREELCLKGRKIAYEDFTKFVKRGSSYTPLVCWSGDIKSDDKVMDFAPLLSVGVAEVVTMLSHARDMADLRFLGWLQDLPSSDNWYDMLERAGEMLDHDIADTDTMVLAETLRSSLIDYRFVTVRRIYSLMQALWWLNPKSYCIALIETLKLAFSVISVFMVPKSEFEKQFPRFAHPEVMSYEGVVKSRLTRFGAVEYTTDSGRKRLISDGRGLGLSTLTLFLIDMWNRYGENSAGSAVPYRSRESREYAQSMFDSCLGDDFVARLLKNGRCNAVSCDENIIMMGNEANFLAVDCSDSQERWGLSVGRGIYEGHLLWKYAVGADNVENVGVIPPIDCTYGTRVDFIHSCMDFAFSERGIKMSKDFGREQEASIFSAVMEQMTAGGILESYKKDIINSVTGSMSTLKKDLNTKTAEAESAKGALEDAERSLADKQHIIDELRAEVQSLRTKVRSIYSDETEDASSEAQGVVAEDVSVEDMLKVVNQFRLVVVGGLDTMQQRLEEFGFTNVFAISSERASNNTLVKGDFFCLCTKFLSHKLAYNVETHYSEQLDRFFYFNGTNVEAFLRTCYSFMTQWFD